MNTAVMTNTKQQSGVHIVEQFSLYIETSVC